MDADALRDRIAKVHIAATARMAAEQMGLESPVTWDDISEADREVCRAGAQAVIDDLPRALDALNAVLELHRRAVDIFEPLEFCAACSTNQRTVEWPCATVQAIEGAIND